MSILPRYALRKTKLGCVSMLIAVGFLLGGANERKHTITNRI